VLSRKTKSSKRQVDFRGRPRMALEFNANNIVNLLTVGILLLAGVVGAAVVTAGLFQARSLLVKEFSAYFLSPIAYVVLVVFLVVTGHLFYLTLVQLTGSGPKGVEFPMQVVLGDERFWLVFLFIPPLLTMRLFAEERSTGTLEMLMTAPLRDWQVVVSKYAACLAFYVLLWVPTLVYLPVLLDLHQPIVQPVWTVYSVLFLGGLAAVLVGFLLAFVSLDTGPRLFSFVLFLAGVVCAAVGGWQHYHVDSEHVLEIPAGMDAMRVLTSYL